MNFNIFKVLEKDNKELIHSSFFKFLLENDNHFHNDFLQVSISGKSIPKLEKSYTLHKKKYRFDLEIIEENQIIIVENKFKSFPNHKQLTDYDSILNHFYPNHAQLKFIFCFDKSLFKNYGNWIAKDYGELLLYLKLYIIKVDDNEKKIFIDHYITFLEEYILSYNNHAKDCRKVFFNQSDNDNKFWIRLLYANLKIHLDRYFELANIDATVYVSQGNTSIPLINIEPKSWHVHGKHLLIQLQNGELKFYAHTKDKLFLQDLINFSKTNMNNEYLSFKKLTISEKNKTSYIFKLNIHSYLSETELYNIEFLKSTLIQFYDKINSKIINNYVPVLDE